MTTIERQFNKGCTSYGLLEDGDRILVAVSGGNDSLVLCRLLAQRSRIYRPQIAVAAAHVVMDGIGYESDLSYLQQFCDELGVPLHVLHATFPNDESRSDDRRGKTRCTLCALRRRQTLFAYAAAHGYNKVALGHHQDDILATWLMNIIFEGTATTMQPRMTLQHYALQDTTRPVEVIRPLCLVRERTVKALAAELGLEHQKTPCPYETASRRADAEALLRQLEEMNPEACPSMWHAAGL